MKTLHNVFYRVVRPLVIIFDKIKFGYTYTKAKDLPDNYIVLSNHVTDYDPLLVAASFPKQMYFVASEHVARWGFLSTLLLFFLAPILRYKGSVASSTVKDIFKKIKGGSNVCMFAEGVRTWDGVTYPVLPSTGKMIKRCNCALITYKLVGGYFSSPMWSEGGTRKGYFHGAPVNIYTKEQLAELSVDEINEIIKQDLYEDAYTRQLENPKKYTGKQLAYRMENLLFICPECRKIDSFRSEKDTVTCKHCNLTFTYDEYGMLHGLPFKTVRDLSNWQREQVQNAISSDITYTSESGILLSIKNHEESKIDEGKISLSKDALVCGNTTIPFSDITEMAMHGKHALVFTAQKKYYELTPTDQSNTLKFLWLYEAYNNQLPK